MEISRLPADGMAAVCLGFGNSRCSSGFEVTLGPPGGERGLRGVGAAQGCAAAVAVLTCRKMQR
jgi:hypothetical protein